MRGKYDKKNTKWINVIFISLFFFLLIWLLTEQIQEWSMKDHKEENNNVVIEKVETILQEIPEEISEEIPQENPVILENIIGEYEGHTVSAKLEIPSISLVTYVLTPHSEEALDSAVTHFFGSNANEIGNCCIAGHHYQKDTMFRNLKDVNIGDSIFLSDNTYGKIEYEIYDIYQVFPKEVECLSQDTKGRKEVTLITCTNNAKKRIIVKAREK